MALPWLQIVRLVPSILDVSRELLRKTNRVSVAPETPGDESALAARIAALEDNERRQAQLINQMAEQLAVMARAATTLHRRQVGLILGLAVAGALAIAALVIAA